MKHVKWLLVGLLVGGLIPSVSVTYGQGGVNALFSLQGTTDSANALVITMVTATGSVSAASALANLRGKTDAANALVVTCPDLTCGGSGPFTDSTAIIKGSADDTKLFRVEVDGFTAGATRVFTPPDANLTITAAAGTVLDDATVGAMVDTLFGASSTGTGGAMRLIAPTATTSIQIGSAGVLISDDGDGALTFLSKGNGSGGLEDLTLNLDDTSNVATVSSSTGVTSLVLTGMSLTAGVALKANGGSGIEFIGNTGGLYMLGSGIFEYGTTNAFSVGYDIDALTDGVMKVRTRGNAAYAIVDGQYRLSGKSVFSGTAPTIASGGCTSPAMTSTNGTAAFKVTLGTSCSTVKTVTLTFPAATVGWSCSAVDQTAPQTYNVVATTTSTTAVVLSNYGRTTGLAVDYADSEVLVGNCTGL